MNTTKESVAAADFNWLINENVGAPTESISVERIVQISENNGEQKEKCVDTIGIDPRLQHEVEEELMAAPGSATEHKKSEQENDEKGEITCSISDTEKRATTSISAAQNENTKHNEEEDNGSSPVKPTQPEPVIQGGLGRKMREKKQPEKLKDREGK